MQTAAQLKSWCEQRKMVVVHTRTFRQGTVVRAYLAMPFGKEKATIVEYRFGSETVELLKMKPIEKRRVFTKSLVAVRKTVGDVEVLVGSILIEEKNGSASR